MIHVSEAIFQRGRMASLPSRNQASSPVNCRRLDLPSGSTGLGGLKPYRERKSAATNVRNGRRLCENLGWFGILKD